jgi:hypothetical protein
MVSEVILLKRSPKHIGNDHVKLVYQAFLLILQKRPIDAFPETVRETVQYITNLYPNINNIYSKFETNSPDHAKDLTLILNDNTIVNVNLFLIKKKARIQPKNPGAKSFFSNYFLSEELQIVFNRSFENYYIEYLQELVKTKIGEHYIKDKKELKKEVSKYFSKFNDSINPIREKFLYKLREECFQLLRRNYNDKNLGFINAFSYFFMTEDLNIITRYGKKDGSVIIEELKPAIPQFNEIDLYKVGMNTVGIKFGQVSLTLRFKFESSPTSSVKLATSYDTFPSKSHIESTNSKTIRAIDKLVAQHEHVPTNNISDQVGKCHEAFTYYYFLKDSPVVTQVDDKECINILKKNYNCLNPELLMKIFHSTSSLIQEVKKRLKAKYQQYSLFSIELVPTSYVKDKLDTGDLQLTLKVRDKYIIEKISLKALSKRGSKITTKNPGIGTILGSTYFDIGTMDSTVEIVKEKYLANKLVRRESQEYLAKELGNQLNNCTQDKLKKGIESLLGAAMLAITFYSENINYCKEISEIKSFIKVLREYPTSIQNTLSWNDDLDRISLRVKFSKGENHGWSSVKLTSEYTIN